MQHVKSADVEVELLPVEQRVKVNAGKLNQSESSAPEPKTSAGSSKINLPSNVFASEAEEDVGLLNKAAPMGLRLDWDPDVMAAMDEDFDFEDPENQLEDNFMDLANAEG